MKLYIKNMVSICSIRVVQFELKKLGLSMIRVDLGEVAIEEDIDDSQLEQIRIALQRFGLELMEDKRTILVESIKNLVIEIVYSPDLALKGHFSAYITGKLHYHYTYLSNLFSEVMGITIEQFLIAHKIERAKELISYDELNLPSMAHLCISLHHKKAIL
jgi:AraC-like DNA-binding protein